MDFTLHSALKWKIYCHHVTPRPLSQTNSTNHFLRHRLGKRHRFSTRYVNKDGLCFSLHTCSLEDCIRLVFRKAAGTFSGAFQRLAPKPGLKTDDGSDSGASLQNRLVQVEGVAVLFFRTQPPGCHTAVSPCKQHLQDKSRKYSSTAPTSSPPPDPSLGFLFYGSETQTRRAPSRA